jgi:hypothetical protein
VGHALEVETVGRTDVAAEKTRGWKRQKKSEQCEDVGEIKRLRNVG